MISSSLSFLMMIKMMLSMIRMMLMLMMKANMSDSVDSDNFVVCFIATL